MQNKHTLKAIYLCIVITFFAFHAVKRIYKFGKLIETNLCVAELTAKKKELLEEKENLQLKLNTKYSLTTISMLNHHDYVPINNHIVINFNKTLALR